MRISRPLIGSLLLLTVFGAVAQATPTIVVGDFELLPNLAGQQRQIWVSGEATDLVQGLDFYIQVADGGPTAVELGYADIGIVGPAITDINLSDGTIFADNHDPQSILFFDNGPQLWSGGVLTAAGDVVADGLLATVTFDTTGFGPESVGQTWDLSLTDVAGGLVSTSLLGDVPQDQNGIVFSDIYNGSITVVAAPVPEPSTVALLAMAVTGAAFWWLRRR